MNFNLHSYSPSDTQSAGGFIGRQLKGREIVLLSGELGSGKTQFTKGIAQAMGIDEGDVVSPSYTLMNQFEGDKRMKLYHLDLYRIGTNGSASLPEIDDYIDEGIIVIEWAQFLEPGYFESSPTIHISFHLSSQNDSERTLEISSNLDYIKKDDE
jgi:tRNA threonylcarbamoyladenosine biosynthesis protein TsaE